MSFESFIARRYFGSGRFFVSVSTWITIIGVTLGVATVCFVTSMHNGFESELRSRLLGTSSHISIFPYRDTYITEYRGLVDQLKQLDHVTAVSPFVFYKAAISSASAGDGIIVRGIDLEMERNTANIEKDIKAGIYGFDAGTQGTDTLRGMLIGDGLAERLGVYLGDPVVLYSLQGEDLRSGARPRVAKFLVTGIFETGLYEFDGSMAYISLPDAQNLFKIGDAVTAVHMKLDDIYLAETMSPQIDSLLEFRYDVVPWTILHKNLFSWIAIENWRVDRLSDRPGGGVDCPTLVMLTMEKRSEIGILTPSGRTGVGKADVRLQGLTIATIGVLADGNRWQRGFAEQVEDRLLPPDICSLTYVPIDHRFWITGGRR
jgi:lipoprotein-releasing system permease protein